MPLPRAFATLLAFAALGAPSPVPDLDVSIPPGAPQAWGQGFPAFTPPPLPPPATPIAGPDAEREGRTYSRPRSVVVDVPLTTSAGLLRILTWDLAAHLTWVLPLHGPRTGDPSAGGFQPLPGEALYWVGLAPLLRYLLHPGQVSLPEVAAHLVELGAPVLAPLEAAEGEEGLTPLRALVASRVRFQPAAPTEREWSGARSELLARFTRDELLAEHPYDPEGAFGRRLLLLGDTVVPILVLYAEDACPPLRRAATAALTRYRTPDALRALNDLAVRSADPVVFARACSALSRARRLTDANGLIARLRQHRDPIESVLLLDVLGRSRRDDVVPALVAETSRALAEDHELLVAALGALAELWKPRDPRLAITAALAVATAAREDPQRFAIASQALEADVPDFPTVRPELLTQLATIVRARLDPEDTEARGTAVGWSAPQANAGGGRFSERALAGVQPRARLVYLDLLAELGGPALPNLRQLAGDAQLDPALRGAVLAHLPADERDALAATLAADLQADPELRVQALEVLVADDHARLVPIARGVLAEAAQRDAGVSVAAERQLLLTALRALTRKGAHATERLLPLLGYASARGADAADVQRDVLDGIDALLLQEAQEPSKARRAQAIEELLERMVASGRRAAPTPTERAALLKRLGQIAAGAKGHASDPGYLRMLADSMVEALLGTAPRRLDRSQGQFEPVVAVPEALFEALASVADEPALAALVAHLADPHAPYRAQAAVALTSTAKPAALEPLARALLDSDPAVRLLSAEGLRALTGQEHTIDWLTGTPHDLALGAAWYLEWIHRER